MPLGFGGGLDGELCVPRADRDDTPRKSGIALVATARPISPGDSGRQAQDKTNPAPYQHGCGDRDGDSPKPHQNRSFDPVALPSQHDLAGLIDEPRLAKRKDYENEEKKENP